MGQRPAILGGTPIFNEPLAFARPTREPGYGEDALAAIETSLSSGMFTDGPLVRELEERSASELGAAHCVAVASGTIGLLLLLQALEVDGPVLVPSFTFSATAHAVVWNGLDVVFADCDPNTWCLGPEQITGRPAAIIGVHVSGVPVDVIGVEKIAAEIGVPVIYDAAHGAGSLFDAGNAPTPLGGFGAGAVFSLTPTKVMSGAEGGLITTDDPDLAAHLRVARNYGNPGDYDTRFAGLNARLSEFHAALALGSLERLEDRVAHRNTIAERYHAGLSDVPGVDNQRVPTGSRSSYKDFTIRIDEASFGASRDAVNAALQAAYADVVPPPLPVTEQLAREVITLPMWSHLPLEDADRVIAALARIADHAPEIDAMAAAKG
jgi:dTDP-4-amino-4,6-dideoxygalactose transaminase